MRSEMRPFPTRKAAARPRGILNGSGHGGWLSGVFTPDSTWRSRCFLRRAERFSSQAIQMR